jgi:hypothetical protein
MRLAFMGTPDFAPAPVLRPFKVLSNILSMPPAKNGGK